MSGCQHILNSLFLRRLIIDSYVFLSKLRQDYKMMLQLYQHYLFYNYCIHNILLFLNNEHLILHHFHKNMSYNNMTLSLMYRN